MKLNKNKQLLLIAIFLSKIHHITFIFMTGRIVIIGIWKNYFTIILSCSVVCFVTFKGGRKPCWLDFKRVMVIVFFSVGGGAQSRFIF